MFYKQYIQTRVLPLMQKLHCLFTVLVNQLFLSFMHQLCLCWCKWEISVAVSLWRNSKSKQHCTQCNIFLGTLLVLIYLNFDYTCSLKPKAAHSILFFREPSSIEFIMWYWIENKHQTVHIKTDLLLCEVFPAIWITKTSFKAHTSCFINF